MLRHFLRSMKKWRTFSGLETFLLRRSTGILSFRMSSSCRYWRQNRRWYRTSRKNTKILSRPLFRILTIVLQKTSRRYHVQKMAMRSRIWGLLRLTQMRNHRTMIANFRTTIVLLQSSQQWTSQKMSHEIRILIANDLRHVVLQMESTYFSGHRRLSVGSSRSCHRRFLLDHVVRVLSVSTPMGIFKSLLLHEDFRVHFSHGKISHFLHHLSLVLSESSSSNLFRIRSSRMQSQLACSRFWMQVGIHSRQNFIL